MTTPEFKTLSRDYEQADTADQVYRGLIRVRLIVSDNSACLWLQCEFAITAKITPETEGGRIWATTTTFVTFVTWVYANSSRWTRISRSCCQTTNTTGNNVKTEMTTSEFKIPSRDSEQADTADQVYRGLIRVQLIVSDNSACLWLQCEFAIGAKITPETEGDRFWATTPTFVTFVTWLYANSSRWTSISRSRCKATNTTGNDVQPEVTMPESKTLSRDSEQADTADQVYCGLIRMQLIVSDNSASLWLQYEFAIGAKITPEKEGGPIWATTPTFVTFVTWLYANSSRWTRISRSRCQATNTTGNNVKPEVTIPEFKILSRDSEQADTADKIYRGLIRVQLIVSDNSACLWLQCEFAIGAKITHETEGGRVWATTPTYVNFVTWLYANSNRWTSISRSRCQATNTTGNDVIPEATSPEFLKSVTWFWTSRHRWPRISRSHSRVIDSFREIGFPLAPVRKFD